MGHRARAPVPAAPWVSAAVLTVPSLEVCCLID